jgi:hypothetical protein
VLSDSIGFGFGIGFGFVFDLGARRVGLCFRGPDRLGKACVAAGLRRPGLGMAGLDLGRDDGSISSRSGRELGESIPSDRLA